LDDGPHAGRVGEDFIEKGERGMFWHLGGSSRGAALRPPPQKKTTKIIRAVWSRNSSTDRGMKKEGFGIVFCGQLVRPNQPDHKLTG
jgi:hypothetical protein